MVGEGADNIVLFREAKRQPLARPRDSFVRMVITIRFREPAHYGGADMNQSRHLSKSDFMLARSCAKKLVYKKAGYDSSMEGNSYMKMLAEGGYIVGYMATLLYPDGIEITGKTEEAIATTKQLLEHDNVTLFEAAINVGNLLVRVDVLEKIGSTLRLIEVKSTSYDPTADDPKKKLSEYIYDVAYQYHVLSQAYPQCTIEPYLLVPDKSKRTGIDQLAGWFRVSYPTNASSDKQKFVKPDVQLSFRDQSQRDQALQDLRNDGILTLVDVTGDVLVLQNEITSDTQRFVRILEQGIKASDYELSKSCKSCEYYHPTAEKNGFRECWGESAYHPESLLTLYYGGAVSDRNGGYYLNELINQGKRHLADIDHERLRNAKGELGSRGIRQVTQLKYTADGTEWMSDELRRGLRFEYPLHFIDFETYTGAVPYHAGMRPYETIAFQWSCHTIPTPGAQPIHAEWIHTGPMFPDAQTFPNFEFARSLMRQIGTHGTPLMWATHENTVLRTILEQMENFDVEDDELNAWLTGITREGSGSKVIREGRLVDMNKLTLVHFFHPSMKKVLPAIWTHHAHLHDVPFFAAYAKDLPSVGKQGLIDPYDQLKYQFEPVDGEYEEVVSEGTAAMRAYSRLRFDETLSDEGKQRIRQELLKYCELDTLAMVIIAHHWGIR
jgi:hypothetical protein